MSYNKSSNTFIWGAGHYGVLTTLDFKQKGIKVTGFIDSNANQIKTKLELPVFTPEQALSSIKPYIIVAVQKKFAVNVIADFLKKSNLKENEDYEYSELMPGTKIRNYFLQLNKQEEFEEIKNIVEFFEKNPFSVYPYNFIYKYDCPYVFRDDDCKMYYVMHYNKKLYMPAEWDKEQTADYYRWLCIEQDIDSPHKYETENYKVKKGDVIADIGTAEGLWALENVEKASKVYLFECEKIWIQALQKTFEPYKEKVEIVNKFVSNVTAKSKITIDDFFKTSKINFIKADIEGAERELLLGARNTLQCQNDMKILLCTYHKENDEVVFKEILEEYGFTTEYSKGYMLFWSDKKLKKPYLRKGLVRGSK
ncbi:MAG: FkbM family methyltransferase [Chitinispirillales bacterium]|jgi:hypothetical protein|nr:FkbM family methyltransferase [Chitinispirillales bacterium]